MRKIYVTLMLVALAVLGVQAQVTSLDQLSNSKAYTIASARCFFQVVDGYDSFVTSNGSVEGIVTEASAESANQQFAILKGDNDYYLYSVGAQKFVNSDGSLVAAPGMDTPVTVTIGSSTDYPIMMNYSGNYINTQDTGSGYANGYVINSWSTADAGNQFKVVEVADVDLSAAVAAIDSYEHNAITVTVRYSLCYGGTECASYETTTKGAAPLTVTFDAPQTYLGATCADSTRTSEVANETKTINVVYNYTLNAAELPIVPTTVKDGVFADSTKWYYLEVQKKGKYCYYNGGDMIKAQTLTSQPAESKYFYSFVGNPVSGFQIYTYDGGADKMFYTSSGSEDLYVGAPAATSLKSFDIETGTSTDQYRLHVSNVDDSYVNLYSGVLTIYTWNWWAANDEGSQYYINEVSEDMLKLATGGKMEIVSTTPEVGTVNGGLPAEISIVFDEPIYRVCGLDHEGYSYDGEDVVPVVLKDANGNDALVFNNGDDENGYEINEENPYQLDFYMSRPITEEGTYTLVLPTKLVYTEKGLTNAAANLIFNVKEAFNAVTVTGRVYNTAVGEGSGSAFANLPYDSELGYYEIEVEVKSKDEVVLKGYAGASGYDMDIIFDKTGAITSIDGENSSEVWANTGYAFNDYGGTLYSGYYRYINNSSCKINFDTEDGVGYGSAAICGYDYGTSGYSYFFVDWYLDNRYATDSSIIHMVSTTPAEGEVEKLESISVSYDREILALRNGEGDAQVTLTDADGNAVGGTISATINATDAKVIDFTLSEPITALGVYTFHVPSGFGERETDDAPGITKAVTVTYQIGGSAPVWTKDACNYLPADAQADDATIAAAVKDAKMTVEYYDVTRTLVVHNWMGVEDDDLTIVLNADTTIAKINGYAVSEDYIEGYMSDNCPYYYVAFYQPYCSVSLDENTGSIVLGAYYYTSYTDYTYGYYYITWDADVVTAIDSVEATKVAGRGIYNLAGQKMNNKNLKAGIYLKDGKKVVIK